MPSEPATPAQHVTFHTTDPGKIKQCTVVMEK
jgi:hypothetical protein